MGVTVDQGRSDDQSAVHWLDHDGVASALLRARGGRSAGPRSADALRLAAFGLDPATAQAPLVRAAAGLALDGRCWFRARPVHLVADLDRVHLVPGAVDDLTPEDAAELAALVHGHLAGEGGALQVIGTQEWSLGTVRPWNVSVDGPEQAARGPLEAALPAGPDARALRGLLTELQMLLHGAPANQRRMARGQAAVNGLWLWSSGAEPVAVRQAPPSVHGADALLRALAALAGQDVRAAPQPSPGWYEPAALAGAGFAAQLLSALQRFALRSVHVHVPEVGSWRITPMSSWQWWRGRSA